jgi:hypothetical protein
MGYKPQLGIHNIAPIIYRNRSKLCVIAVEWNKPLYTPIPVSKDVTYKLSNPMIPEYSNIRIATLLNQIINMSLKVTALTKKKVTYISWHFFNYTY